MKTKDRNENLRSYKLDIKINLSHGHLTLAVVVILLLSQYGEFYIVFVIIDAGSGGLASEIILCHVNRVLLIKCTCT